MSKIIFSNNDIASIPLSESNIHASTIDANKIDVYKIDANKITINGHSVEYSINNISQQYELLIEYLKFKGIYITEEFNDFIQAYNLVNKLNAGDKNG